MREIKFRAWNPHQNIMLGWDRLALLPACQFLTDNGYKTMQFTGLCDKNGKEIYEGDILRVLPRLVENVDEFIAPIIWKGCGFELERPADRFLGFPIVYKLNGTSCMLEVIGNIYENPELLEVGNDASRT